MLDRAFTIDELGEAVDLLSTIPGWRETMRSAVMGELMQMVPHHRALKWLSAVAVARCRMWPGLAELRGLLCTHFDAADGLDEPSCSIPGFTPEDGERRYLEAARKEASSELPIPKEILQLAAKKRM